MDAVTLEENFLLQNEHPQNEKEDLFTGDGSVDINGNPVLKHSTGRWKACSFILGTECCERLTYHGISTNLVNYLAGSLHESNVSAARNVTTWTGTCSLTPVIGAVLADAYWGRYWTIVVFSMIFFIGLCTLTLSASVPVSISAECKGSVCASGTTAQQTVFFLGLYLIALGTGGIKPCVSSFGADQFDHTDPIEGVQQGSFFNWFNFSIAIGSLVSSTLIVWIQENAGWVWGFGILALCMGITIGCFLGGTRLYRFQRPGCSPITRMSQVIVASLRKWRLKVPIDVSLLYGSIEDDSGVQEKQKLEHTNDFWWLDKAAIVVSDDGIKSGTTCRGSPWRLCTVTQVEELKIIMRLLPIWATVIMYSTVYVQMPTLFVEQANTMNRAIGSFTIPAASLSTFEIIAVIICVPVYDFFLIPLARKFTGEARGLSALQRMGIGLVCSILAMLAAALVEIQRLRTIVRELRVETEEEEVVAPVALTILWQIPQYLLIGVGELFTFIGKLEFFYDQSPQSMKSVCTAFALLTTSVGFYLSSLIVTIVTAVTTAGGKTGWIPDNLSEGHLDYFFLLMAGLSILNLLLYLFCARRYKIKKTIYFTSGRVN